MMKPLLIPLAVVLGSTSVLAAEPAGEMFAHTSAACHGTYGQIKNELFVPLAGMNKSEFIASMKSFRDMKRPSSIVSHIANGYNDIEIEKMANYFAKLDNSVDEAKGAAK